MHDDTDTIAAIATAAGEGAIAIVRVSGAESLAIADRVIACADPPPSHRPPGTFVHGHLCAVAGERRETVDEVIVLIYRAPHSYTREDSVEIQGHGGTTAARRILRALLQAGARLAEPGEFTRRAFLNGRIDLLQAEAVLDLIRARTDRAAAAAVEQLDGTLSRTFDDLYDGLVDVAAGIEATLDFPEDDVPSLVWTQIKAKLTAIIERMAALLQTWDEGVLLREGATVAILGRPNVGKSTLLNAMLGMDRAIVSHMPGTTRDVVEESMSLGGVAIRLADTAGLRDTECHVENAGIERAKALMAKAAYVLYVLDASEVMSPDDRDHLAQLTPDRTVLVANKCDYTVKLDYKEIVAWTVVPTSLIRGEGVTEVKAALGSKIMAGPATPPHAVISERHRALVVTARDEVLQALDVMSNDGCDPVLMASGLRLAIAALGLVTGREYHDELLDAIFTRFCIGK